MQKAPSGNGTIKSSGNIINIAANKPVSAEYHQNQNLSIHQLFFCFAQPLQHQQQPTQQYSSNIPTHKPNNFQQTLPRYNPPPQLNPARRLVQRGRYSTGTTSLIPAPGSAHPPLISPALSTASSAQASIQGPENQPKSHLAYPSRIPSDMLKFQVRKSDGDAAPPSGHPHGNTNAQLQVSQNLLIGRRHARKVVDPLRSGESFPHPSAACIFARSIAVTLFFFIFSTA